jgi:hypothetical protein
VVLTPTGTSSCVCAFLKRCLVQLSIYDDANFTSLFDVPGLYMGCYVIEGFLVSTLECFYNQTCINTLQSYMENSSLINVAALDSSLLIRHNESSTIQELVNDLMVDHWNLSSVYESYYEECEPIKCTYIHLTKNDKIYIITTVFGLIGGLVTVLTFIIPQLVKYLRRYLRFTRLETGKTERLQKSKEECSEYQRKSY